MDGDTAHPHYRYGGLWKNHHAAVSGRGKVPPQRGATSSCTTNVAAAQLQRELLAAAAEQQDDDRIQDECEQQHT